MKIAIVSTLLLVIKIYKKFIVDSPRIVDTWQPVGPCINSEEDEAKNISLKESVVKHDYGEVDSFEYSARN